MSKRKSQRVILPEIVDVKVAEDEEDPLNMINEEQFDSGGIRTRKSSSLKKSIKNEKTQKEKSAPNANAIPLKILTCARLEIELFENSNIYKLRCIHCETSVQLVEWKHFVRHMENEHANQFVFNDSKVKNPTELGTATNVNVLNEEPAPENLFVDNSIIKTEIYESDFEDLHNDVRDGEDFHDDAPDDVDYKPEPGIENQFESEPPEKKLKLRSTKEESEDDNKRTYKKDERIITFTRTDKKIVCGFLEMVKEHPLLWQRRQSIIKRYDKVLQEMSSKFNAKYPKHTMSTNDMRLSIYRIKKLYEKAINPKDAKNQNEGDASFKTKFPDYFALCIEIEEEGKKMAKKCDYCGISFIDDIDLQIHAFQMHRIGELPFKCGRCSRRFVTEIKLLQHEKKDHAETPYNCVICNKSFDKEQRLHSHMAIHIGAKQICEICGKSFDSSYRYRRHMLHHAPPQFKCEICGKMLYEKYTLSEHMKTHFNERRYACEICGKTFNINNGLQIHRRQVHKVKTQYVWGSKTTMSEQTTTSNYHTSSKQTTTNFENQTAHISNQQQTALSPVSAVTPQPIEMTTTKSEQSLSPAPTQNPADLSHAVFQDRLFNDILSLQQQHHQENQV